MLISSCVNLLVSGNCMTSPQKQILYSLAGILILSLSLYCAHLFWYDSDGKDSCSTPAALLTIAGPLIGLGLIFNEISEKTKYGVLIPGFGMLLTFFLMQSYHESYRHKKIQQEGQITLAVVTFRDNVRGWKGHKHEEIRYTYYVNGKTYEKSADNQTYIKANDIRPNDTLIISYWSRNPNYHNYTIKRNSR